MRKSGEGSRIERGRKNRTNIRKNVSNEPATVAHTMRRRILFTGGSELVSNIAAGAAGFAGVAARGGVETAVLPDVGADI